MQGQEKLTFVVILLFFSITLCCTLISANEKGPSAADPAEEPLVATEDFTVGFLLPFTFSKFLFQSVSRSVKTIFTMPFVLRRLTMAECCSWLVVLWPAEKGHFFHSFSSI